MKGSLVLSIPLRINTPLCSIMQLSDTIEDTLYHCCLEQTISHIFEDYSTARPLSNTPQVHPPLSHFTCVFVSFLYVPVSSIRLYIFSPSRRVSISSCLCHLVFLSAEQLYRLIVASLFFLVGRIQSRLPILFWPTAL